MIPLEPDEPDYLERQSKIIRGLINTERVLASTLLVATFGLVLSQVISRYVFSTPFTWTEELARFALVWLTFLAAGFVMARRMHVTVDLVAAKLGPRSAIVLNTFAMLVVLVISAAMAIAGAAFAATASRLNAPATQLPMSVVYAAAAIGFALIFVHGVLNLYVNLRHPDQVATATDPLEQEAA